MTERARLTDALALATRPREREYAVHDTALQGFMLRVQPNGARSWVFRFRRDGKPRRVTLGKPDAVKADQARAAALAFLAREKGGGSPARLPASGPTLTKLAAEYVERRSPSWKPSTVKATLSYLNSAILPALGHLRVGPVVRADIARFFHEYGRRKPGDANRSHDILRNMFDCAIAWGHRPEAAGNRHADLLFNIVSSRSQQRSTIVTTRALSDRTGSLSSCRTFAYSLAARPENPPPHPGPLRPQGRRGGTGGAAYVPPPPLGEGDRGRWATFGPH